MPAEWGELTKITQGAEITVERVRLTRNKIVIEGEFELPPLARLQAEEQVFIMAFIQCHGSIKDMEQMFGISYPTVKNRLNRLAEALQLVEHHLSPPTEDTMEALERGEITAAEAIERLSK